MKVEFRTALLLAVGAGAGCGAGHAATTLIEAVNVLYTPGTATMSSPSNVQEALDQHAARLVASSGAIAQLATELTTNSAVIVCENASVPVGNSTRLVYGFVSGDCGGSLPDSSYTPIVTRLSTTDIGPALYYFYATPSGVLGTDGWSGPGIGAGFIADANATYDVAVVWIKH